MSPPPQSCAIFCRVIDNYGDAGVCWRLARQLVEEYGWQVSLYIDHPQRLAQFLTANDHSRVAILPWTDSFVAPPIPGVVIEAFACDLPTDYIKAMMCQPRAPIWINLEYLSAEPWVEGCHGLASRHPGSHLVKYFFFPGFSEPTGGLLRESDYRARQTHFDAIAFAHDWSIPHRPEELRLSYFAYPGAPFEVLISNLTESATPVRLLIPGGKSESYVKRNLAVQSIPFLPQSVYDELLWFCDINFVRGEDSFVRAQLTGKPCIWSIYPQSDHAHAAKLDAFLDKYLGPDACTASASIEPESLHAIRDAWTTWNAGNMFDWAGFHQHLPTIQQQAIGWRNYLFKQADLACQLTRFCDDLRDRIE